MIKLWLNSNGKAHKHCPPIHHQFQFLVYETALSDWSDCGRESHKSPWHFICYILLCHHIQWFEWCPHFRPTSTSIRKIPRHTHTCTTQRIHMNRINQRKHRHTNIYTVYILYTHSYMQQNFRLLFNLICCMVCWFVIFESY